MRTWKLAPKDPQVAKFVECYWFLKREQGDVGNNRPKLNPDPAAHLIVTQQRQRFSYQQESSTQTSIGCHWLYAHRQTYLMDHSEPFQILGIKFKVGGLYGLSFAKCTPALDIIQNIASNDLIELDSMRVQQLLLLACNDKEQVVDRLDKMLLPCLAKCQPDNYTELTQQILEQLMASPIQDLGELLHRSQRTLERSFLRTTNLTLKQCKSMIRLEQVLNTLYKMDKKAINWSDLAHQFEFSDQPHLIRYLKSAIGHTPSQYAQKRDLTIDIYGDFEII